ncbi:class I SAM-dependent methyltransferase [Nitrobacter sp. TKz-YC02]|uniref:class I SAM-dependent methyltransferase n=1 Tax=Nitrobacter sp. TKz-YC02 TaxID=3398704 RepID=UPI003CF3771F
MGIDLTGLRALSIASRIYKFSFRNTVTLGRHEIHFWKQEFDLVQRNLGIVYDESITVGAYCEPLLRKLGAESITSIDASAFEGASLIHDFNLPIPENLREQFDTFLDFGSIEHIFDVAQVVDNIVNLVKPGGQILVGTNANGFPSHGLYQFSPEFFYSLFSKRNGFEDTSVFLVNLSRPKMWNLIKRPVELKRRNEVPFEDQMMMLIFSRKVGNAAPLTVVQSDYDDTWTRFETGNWSSWNRDGISNWKKVLHGLVSPYVYRIIGYRFHSLQARRKYRNDRILINPDTLDPKDFGRMISDRAAGDTVQDRKWSGSGEPVPRHHT